MFICRKRASRYPIFLFGRMPMPNEGSHSPERRHWRRICSGKTEGLNEQGRSRDHESSDEGDQTRKQHYVAQEHTHTRLPLSPLLCGPSGIRKSTAVAVPGLKNDEIGKASQSRPARGRPCLLQSLRCCFE